MIGAIWLVDKKSWEDIINQIVEPDFYILVKRMNEKTVKKVIAERKVLTIVFTLFGFSIAWSRDGLSWWIVLISFIVGFKGYYYLLKRRYQQFLNIAREQFPFYLNRLCILIQTEPIPVALNSSINDAPQVFRSELKCLVQEIHEGKKEGVEPYLTFAQKFPQITECLRIFRMLHALSISITQKDRSLMVLNRIAHEKLITARKRKLDNFLDQQALIPWILFFWVGMLIVILFSVMNLEGMM